MAGLYGITMDLITGIRCANNSYTWCVKHRWKNLFSKIVVNLTTINEAQLPDGSLVSSKYITARSWQRLHLMDS